MNADSEPDGRCGAEAPQPGGEPTAEESARIVARVSHLFRHVGDNTPARSLEQQLIAYRLGVKPG
jgi:hypothetical protein